MATGEQSDFTGGKIEPLADLPSTTHLPASGKEAAQELALYNLQRIATMANLAIVLAGLEVAVQNPFFNDGTTIAEVMDIKPTQSQEQ